MSKRVTRQGFGSGKLSKGHNFADKDRLIFFLTSGVAFSLFVTLIVIVSHKKAIATEQLRPSLMAPIPVQPSTVGSITLLAPDKPIRAGTKLSEVEFKEVYWPRNRIPEGAIRSYDEVKTLYARVNLSPGTPIEREMLSEHPMKGALPVTPGNRAIAIDVDATSSLEGHALPGTRVDVVVTYTENQRLTTQVIVQNARVLSFAGETRQLHELSPADKRNVKSTTITLDVSVGDALKIATARQIGRLSLLMRAVEDEKKTTVTEVNQNEIQGGGRLKEEPVRSVDRPSCKRGVVRYEGREYILGCDGSLNAIAADEP